MTVNEFSFNVPADPSTALAPGRIPLPEAIVTSPAIPVVVPLPVLERIPPDFTLTAVLHRAPVTPKVPELMLVAQV